MNYYQEISLLSNVDVSLYFLWKKVYRQVHLALVEHKNIRNTSSVGVSFPGYNVEKNSLGRKLRLFSENEEVLKCMQLDQKLSGLMIIYL